MLWRQSSNWPVSGWTRPFEELDRLRRQMDLLSGGLSRGLWGEPAAGDKLFLTRCKNNRKM